ncbi:MAG: hypothetical protein KGL51_05270 [Betaproteobacteria bacterium]|nr:hypothetical protein [Betaproteobacteria bacterium]MDE2122607.1 hypothetical protein [Betaproteobacteria bacterium]MDE2186555.1 hypothetical protein [Betaproteobacteria bacterium]MDE2324067.1 hypothetical protein [Betaproteobacteria bacterium]
MKIKSYTKLAVDLLGGPTKAANKLEVCTSTVSVWIKLGGVAKKATALRLAKLTGIDYKSLLRGQP